MKGALILEDTPKGVFARVVWQTNDCTDHIPDSLTMMLLANLTEQIRTMARVGAVRCDIKELHDQRS